MKSEQNNEKKLADLEKKLHEFRKQVDAYKTTNIDNYTKVLEQPVFAKRNSDFHTEIDAKIGFFKVCGQRLSDSKTSTEHREKFADKIIQTIKILNDDIERYLNAPGINPTEKATCESLIKDLDKVSQEISNQYPKNRPS